jgi:DNA-binding HxlR family transcriptional regulator
MSLGKHSEDGGREVRGFCNQLLLRYRLALIGGLGQTQQGQGQTGMPGPTGLAAAALGIGEVLALVGAGAVGPILMALGNGPLRTKALTGQISRFAPRTIYRYAGRMAEVGLVDRREEAGVPSRVIYSLSEGPGCDLYRLLAAWAEAWMGNPASGQIDDGSWTAVGLLGEMWQYGWVDQLSRQPRSAAELAELSDGLTFHQANRRAHQLCSQDLLLASGGRRVRYQLGDRARQGMALVAGVARWRQRNVPGLGHAAATVPEIVTILRAAHPLLRLPDFPAKSIKLGVVGPSNGNGGSGAEKLLFEVEGDERVRCPAESEKASSAWVAGTTGNWLAAIGDGRSAQMRVGGDLSLVNGCIAQIHEVLGLR